MTALTKPVPLRPDLCPRTLHTARPSRPCLKPLKDFKCPQHGLIREVMK